MEDFSDELREIKHEIVESRGLIIKTNNLVNALAADLKGVSKRQIAFERRAFWNSASANILFLVVVIGVVKFAWDARVEAVQGETRVARDKIAKLENDVREMQRRSDERLKAETQATQFYELIRADRRQEIIDGWESLRKSPLSRSELMFLGDAVDRARSELSIRAYQAGLDHVRAARWQEAASAMEEAIHQKETAAHIPSAKLNLARAYRKLGRQRDAIPILTQLAEASPDKEIIDDAAFLLAECFIDIQAYNDAKSTLRAFIRRFPESSFANDARLTLADLSVRH